MKKIYPIIWITLCFALFLFSLPAGNVPGQLVKNKGQGLWAAKGKKVIFHKQLAIGTAGSDEQKLFNKPMEVLTDKHGNIYVLDTENCRIQKFDRKGNYLLTIASKGEGPGEIIKAWDIALDSKGNIVVFDWMTKRISRFSPQGAFIDSFNTNLPARYGVLDSQDNIYLYAMSREKLIHKYNPQGKYQFSFMDAVKSKEKRTMGHVNSLGRIAITQDDTICLALIYPYTIYMFNTEGRLLKKIVTETGYAAAPHITRTGTVITNFLLTGLDISPRGYIFCRNIFFKIPDKLDNNKMKEIFTSLYQDHSYVDIFDPEGNFLIHQKTRSFSWGGYFDKEGKYYGIEEGEEGFIAVKYSPEF